MKKETVAKEEVKTEEASSIEEQRILLFRCTVRSNIIVLNNFIPTRETMYKMLIASYVTPENLDLGVNFTKETFEYFLSQIVEAINKVK